MAAIWKTIITIVLLYVIVIDANRARRRRQSGLNPQSANPNTINAATDARQQPMPPNPQILNVQGQPQLNQQQQQLTQGGIGIPRDANGPQNQVGRQYYPYQNQQYNYGSQGSIYNPYGNSGGYGSQYGSSQYGQYGQGMGQYGSFYQNQYPSSGNFYSGSGYSGSNYNRPGYQSNYYPSSGNFGSYYWNAGEKQIINRFLVFLSSLLAVTICLIV
ncbi:unnamed protein product [Adineta ricciae]|uniref:Uncharacterized protein n=1 Tax=Adineta ricciae TaxID=249248 RepID=A0A814MYE7_ADIRI|nr:unnamed protein product [Adineta ricciae]